MRRSAGIKFFIVGLMALVMFIPLFFVSDVILERGQYSDEATRSISDEWGGAQQLLGPVMVLPVLAERTVTRRRQRVDPVTGEALIKSDGKPIVDLVTETVSVPGQPIWLFPDRLDLAATMTSETWYRGIFSVPVYKADTDVQFDFDTSRAAALLGEAETIQWNKSVLRMRLSSNRALRRAVDLQVDGQSVLLEPVQTGNRHRAAIEAALGDPRKVSQFTLTLGLNGAEELSMVPVARDTTLILTSDWPDPKFQGAFLPDSSDISDQGFTANWKIPHLARPLPQVTREFDEVGAIYSARFGVAFITPNNFYQKAYRAARYSTLFIGLTFLTVFLIERSAPRPAHSVQYMLIGLAQVVFLLLMVSLAEQVGFAMAYLISSAATIGLLTLYAATGMKLGRRAGVLGGLLVVLYAVLYLILRSSDYALLAGSFLAFAAIALTMFATRNEDWVDTTPKRPTLRKRSAQPTPPAQPQPE